MTIMMLSASAQQAEINHEKYYDAKYDELDWALENLEQTAAHTQTI